MKKTISILLLFLFVLLIVLFPSMAACGAKEGLLLWYSSLLPALLPLAILSNMLILTGYYHYITKYLYPVVRYIYPMSEEGMFPFFAGLLFGFPLGSKITADLVRKKEISLEEGNILLCITNQFSPVFISTYIFIYTLKEPGLIKIGYLFLYLPPLLYGYIKLWLLHKRKGSIHSSISSVREKKAASRCPLDFEIIDAAIMNGFETLVKLGGYIMLFSILAVFTKSIPYVNRQTAIFLTGLTEVTNGIHAARLLRPHSLRFCFIIGCTALGGLCGLAQSSSMIKDSGLSIKKYILAKIGFAICSTFLAYTFMQAYLH